MTLGLAFYVIMLLWFLGIAWTRGPLGPQAYALDVLVFVLFLLVGWRIFGAPIHG